MGLATTMGTPRRAASLSVESIRGWLVPGLWPMQKMASARAKSSSVTVPFPIPMDSGRPTLVPSWHMLEQSGKLLVPYARTIKSEEHTSELQSLMRISYAVFCLKKKKKATKSIRQTRKTRKCRKKDTLKKRTKYID